MNSVEWVDDVIRAIGAVIDPPSWPSPEDDDYPEFSRAWVTAFRAERVTPDAARAAVTRLAGCPPRYRREYLPAVLKIVREGKPGETITDRDSAERASRDCQHCGGQGLASVRLRPGYESRGTYAAAYCECPMGRWTRQRHSATAQDVLRRTPDLADVLAGRTAWEVASCGVPV